MSFKGSDGRSEWRELSVLLLVTGTVRGERYQNLHGSLIKQNYDTEFNTKGQSGAKAFRHGC